MSLEQYFGQIPDPRVERTPAHQVMDMLAIAWCAVLSGADSGVTIETYSTRQTQLARNVPGLAEWDAFAHVFALLDPEAFELSFQHWLQALVSTLRAQLVAIGGKTVNGAYDQEGCINALQLVSAWASEHRLVLGQCAVASKSNEITASPVLLKQLALAGCLVSIDAMGTQSAIVEQITVQQADYILVLKGNQPEQAQTRF
ncbi:MAG: ISAs1 family transposase [Leptolyngbya sp. BL-A-14]